MHARTRQRLNGWYWRTQGLHWKISKYLFVEVNRWGRFVTLERRPDPKCSKCQGDGHLTKWIDWTDEYAGPCPTCPQQRRLALIVFGPCKPTNSENDPPF